MKLEAGKHYTDGHGDLHGPMQERTPGTWLDQFGALYHGDGRQWSHTSDSAGNLIKEQCQHPNARCVYDSDDGEFERWECPNCRERWGVEIAQ